MQRKGSTKALNRKLRLGRVGLPLWAVLVAALAIAAAVGQALGPVLSGSVSGTAQATVNQTIRLAVAPAEPTFTSGVFSVTIEGEALAATAHVDFASTTNDEKTEYRIAGVVRVGQTAAFQLALLNKSGNAANFLLEINAAEGMDVAVNEIASTDVTSLARLSRNTWLGTLRDTGANTAADINVVYEAKDNAALGTYAITGKIVQVSH